MEERCVLEHERVHIELGHKGHQRELAEREVEELTAERLIPEEVLVDVMRWVRSAAEAAAELEVTVDVVETRVRMHREREALRQRAIYEGTSSDWCGTGKSDAESWLRSVLDSKAS